jgi:NADH dehydrogenase
MVLPQGRAFNRQQAELALQRRDVRVRTHTQVAAIEADHVVLRSPTSAESAIPATNEILPVRGVVWTAGLGFRPPVITPSVATDSRGRLRCDPELRLLGHSDVYALGDLASPAPVADPGQGDQPTLPSTAQVAFQQAPLLASTLLHSLAGEPLETFQWKDLGEMLSLGIGEASLTGMGFTLAGPGAQQLRRWAYLTRLPGQSLPLKVAADWLAEWTASPLQR